MTPQERAVSELNDKLAQAFVCPDTTLGKCRDIIASALTETRRAALLEARQVAITYGERARDEDLSGGYTSELIVKALDRLAQEG